jgi:uncharacterized protein (TIGR02996 family)
MTHDEAFLQAIIEAPDDDTPRLVYSDWLEEQGNNSRAEFIRLQCELARLSEGDPRRPTLEARERELLAAYQKEWVGPFRQWTEAWEFRRGFIDTITARLDVLLDHAEELFRAAPLRQATFRPEKIQFQKHVTLPRSQPRPRSVRFSAACAYLTRLSALAVTYTDLGDPGVAALAAAPGPFRLCRLCLLHNQISDAGVQFLAASPHFPLLTSLQLWDIPIGTAGAEALARSQHITHLTELDFSSTGIGDNGVEALVASPNVGRLTALNLRNCGIGGAGIRALLASPYLANLCSLDLQGNHFGRKARHCLRTRFGDRVKF